MSVLQEQPPARLQEPYDCHAAKVMRVVWDRLNEKNEHFMGCIVGREGIGKSQTGLKICSTIDPGFTADQVYFRISEFLKLLRDEDFREGGMYLLDEAGVSFGSRTWHDMEQVLANQALQLIRNHNVGLVFTLPRLGELDSQTQGRLQAFYEITQKIPDDYVTGRWKWIDPDRADQTGEIYKKYPRTEAGKRITSIGFSPPADSLVTPYEERKSDFQRETYDEAIEAHEAQKEDSQQHDDPVEIANKIRDNEGVSTYVKSINDGSQHVIDKESIQNEYDIGRRSAKQVKREIEDDADVDVL